MGENSEKQRRVDQVFFADFQRLVGVAVRQDPALPQFVCKKCHAQFYKCRSVLRAFIQRVNASPTGHVKAKRKYVAFLSARGLQGAADCRALARGRPVTPETPLFALLAVAGAARSRPSRVQKEVPPAWVSARSRRRFPFLSVTPSTKGWGLVGVEERPRCRAVPPLRLPGRILAGPSRAQAHGRARRTGGWVWGAAPGLSQPPWDAGGHRGRCFGCKTNAVGRGWGCPRPGPSACGASGVSPAGVVTQKCGAAVGGAGPQPCPLLGEGEGPPLPLPAAGCAPGADSARAASALRQST